METKSMPEIRSLNRAARQLGVTAKWLKAEADQGRLPCIRAGNSRYLFDMGALFESLSTRIRSSNEQANDVEASDAS